MVHSKLNMWLKLRRELDAQPLDIAVVKVAEYWENPPFTPYYLDISATKSWPDPWTLIGEDIFCDVAKVLAMLYTVYFTKHRDGNKFELRIFRCPKTGYDYNTLWINDGKYILNCDKAVISKEQFPKHFELQKQYTLNDLEVDKY